MTIATERFKAAKRLLMAGTAGMLICGLAGADELLVAEQSQPLAEEQTSQGQAAADTSTTAAVDDEDYSYLDNIEESKNDPLEDFNRAMFSVNEGLDTVILKPLGTVYDYVTPTFMRTGVNNFFSNADDIAVAANNLLQGNFSDMFSDLGRVFFNTTIGVAGLFDVATDLGLEKHDQDFGQTLAVWGVDSGPYVFLPILGPRYLRDAAGGIVDGVADPVWWIFYNDVRWRNSMMALKIVNARANALPMDKIIDEAALDKYAYIRDGYKQRRRHQLDNNPAIIRSRARAASQEAPDDQTRDPASLDEPSRATP